MTHIASPGPHIQFAAVDDAGELKQDGKPASHPRPVTRSHVHVVTGVLPQSLYDGAIMRSLLICPNYTYSFLLFGF